MRPAAPQTLPKAPPVDTTPAPLLPDVDMQETMPTTPIGLSRAGVTRSSKAIVMRLDGAERLFHADIRCFVDLAGSQKGVHMSRFEEGINDAIDAVAAGEAVAIDVLAQRIAEAVTGAQHARHGEVRISARYPVTRRTPVSDVASQEMYEVFGAAAAGPRGARRALGVAAQGMNACPCAQGLIQTQAEAALRADGFSADEVARIVARVPIATHNQRAKGTLYVGAPGGLDVPADALIRIVEDSMSSEIYELLKRTDERYVVDRAHRRPRFVEDSVREMVFGVVRRLPELPDATFLRAHQANFETIHAHDVEAERSGLLGDVRRELMGVDEDAPQISLAEWLAAGPGPGRRS